ncbi:MAG: hypothetical protein HKN82_13460 [Akkermansiaceae bacterium]|nr:hypothetical protein [Akkermansiaceae bacterium]
MEQFVPLIAAVIPIYLLMVVGACLRRVSVLTPAMDDGLAKLVIHVLYPALILDKILGNELLRDPAVVGWGIGVGFAIIVAGLAVGLLVGRLVGLRKGEGSRSFALTTGVQNYGYVAIPLLMVLFREDEKGVLGMLFTHSLGVELAIWTVGMMVLRGTPIKSPRELLKGPMVAVVAGLVLVFSRLDAFIPGPVLSLLGWLGPCAFPVGLMLIGTAIFDLFGKEKLSVRVCAGALVVRMVVMPVLILAAAKYLPLVVEFKQVLVVQAAMPSAVTPIIYARHYGGNPGAAVQVVLTTSIVAVVTIPLIIAWGRWWVGV